MWMKHVKKILVNNTALKFTKCNFSIKIILINNLNNIVSENVDGMTKNAVWRVRHHFNVELDFKMIRSRPFARTYREYRVDDCVHFAHGMRLSADQNLSLACVTDAHLIYRKKDCALHVISSEYFSSPIAFLAAKEIVHNQYNARKLIFIVFSN